MMTKFDEFGLPEPTKYPLMPNVKMMNERIRELREQASDFAEVAWAKQTQATWETNKDIHTIYDEKFAELIVKECAKVATMNQYQSYTTGHYVLKHFGVEE